MKKISLIDNKIDCNNLPKVLAHDMKSVLLAIFAHIYMKGKKEKAYLVDETVIESCVYLNYSYPYMFSAINKILRNKELKRLFYQFYDVINESNSYSKAEICELENKVNEFNKNGILIQRQWCDTNTSIMLFEPICNNYLINLRMGLFSEEEDKLIEKCANIFIKEFRKADKEMGKI